MARLVAEREDVVEELGEIFRKHGFEGTSISLITAQTKLGKGSLYHFFPGGKDEMAEAVLTHIRLWFEQHIFWPLEARDPVAGIESMFSETEIYFHSGQRICLVGAFALDQTRDRFAEVVNGYFTRWISCLAGALVRNGMEEGDARRKAVLVVSGIQGAIILARATNDKQHFADILADLKKGCFAG